MRSHTSGIATPAPRRSPTPSGLMASKLAHTRARPCRRAGHRQRLSPRCGGGRCLRSHRRSQLPPIRGRVGPNSAGIPRLVTSALGSERFKGDAPTAPSRCLPAPLISHLSFTYPSLPRVSAHNRRGPRVEPQRCLQDRGHSAACPRDAFELSPRPCLPNKNRTSMLRLAE